MQNSSNKNNRSLSTYVSLLGIKSDSTQKLFQCSINNLELFGKLDLNDIVKCDESVIYDIFQEWITWNSKRGMSTSSIMCYFNSLRSYLWYRGVKLDQRDIKQNLMFPKILYEIKVPLTKNEIRQILTASNLEFRFQLLSLLSSGLRAGELGQIRRAHLDFSHSNIMVRIPSEITKTGRSRVTFFSGQVSSMIRYRIKTSQSDFLFCENRNRQQSLNLIIKRFAAARKKANLIEKYSHCKQNRYKIHVHSMRAYFITRANMVQFGLGHILAGHNFYMKEYNQYTVDELRHMYKEVEKHLTF